MPKIIIHEYERTAQYFIEDLGNGIQLEMVMIPSGSFMMGSPETEEGSTDDERPQHQVTIKAFCLGKYQVTQAQWKAVAAFPQVNKELKLDPSRFKGDGSTSLTNHRPVEQVSWENAVEFCDRLSRHTKRQYRLPSEAEWEYACRAGTQTRYYFGDDEKQLGEYAWYGQNSGSKTHPVGQKKPNNWGLFDMSGNVWEWCEDGWHENYQNAPKDETAWNDNHSKTKYRVLRGGSWSNYPRNCRSASRLNFGNRLNNYGFRVVAPQNS
jgi:formylglycine-generating enzyme required for sulfatase activity